MELRVRPSTRLGLPRSIYPAMRGATRATGRAVRHLLPFVVWGAVAIFLGVIVGFTAVILPPSGSFVLFGLTIPLLLWVMPELRPVPRTAIRRLYYLMLIVLLCLPAYYTIQIPGLPWISARRMATFALIVAFGFSVSVSASVRSTITAVLKDAQPLAICAIGFLGWAFLSIATSINPSGSLSALINAILAWYIPFFGFLYVIADERDLIRFMRLIGWCSIFVALIAFVEFHEQRRIMVDLMPPFLRAQLMANDPIFAAFVQGSGMRDGAWRAVAVYESPLSLAEFAAMVIPLSYFFIAHGSGAKDRVFGLVLFAANFLAIFCSGSRGGWVSAIVATLAFAPLWFLRAARFERGSVVPAFIGLVSFIGLGTMVAAIMFVGKVHKMVFGSASDQSSTQARMDEFHAAWPHIVANPITGHGFGVGGGVVNFSYSAVVGTLDSSLISITVDGGVPALLFFSGMVLIGIFVCARLYLTSRTLGGALAGCIACSLLAYGTYRVFLSQVENNTLFYLLVACAIWLMHAEARSAKPSKPQSRVSDLSSGDRSVRASSAGSVKDVLAGAPSAYELSAHRHIG